MRKHVNKERCTRIRFVKCNEVCLLYDKVQRAYAEHIDKDKEVKSFEVNVIPVSYTHLLRPAAVKRNSLLRAA